MEGLLGLVAFTIAMSVASLVSSVRRRSQLAAWRQAAVHAGLTETAEGEGGFFTGGFLAGTQAGLLVRLESYRRGKYEHGTRIVVSGPKLPSKLEGVHRFPSGIMMVTG